MRGWATLVSGAFMSGMEPDQPAEQVVSRIR